MKYGFGYIIPDGFGIAISEQVFDSAQEAFEESLNWAQSMLMKVEYKDEGKVKVSTPIKIDGLIIDSQEMLDKYNDWVRTYTNVSE